MQANNYTLTNEQAHIRHQFIEFFDNQQFERRYSERLSGMMRAAKARLVVDMHDLLQFQVEKYSGDLLGTAPGSGENEPLGLGVISRPALYIPLCELAIHELVMRKQEDYLKVDYRTRPVHVAFEGSIGKVLGPRDLYSRHLNTLVALEGIVTRQSSLRPRLIETVHYCSDTNKFSKKAYRDTLTPGLDTAGLPTVNVMPKTDIEGHVLRTELGLSSFLDSQCCVLQELPEASPTGQLPRNVELRMDDDLVDSVKAGDRVTVVGIYLPYTSANSKSFQSIVLVNHVVHNSAAARMPRLLESEQQEMRRFCERCVAQKGPSGVLTTLAQAVAPSIYGLQSEKQAILLMLAGGVERKAHDSHIRGDINVLMVGEPSTAKSQLLRFVLGIAPLALNTTGKGSSGVGLTAAVTVDSYSGERSLSAGAMVLADRGVLCIDEFDKMSPLDRVAMHEAMEQQTVTITKASIHATLNARCSVLAAANPVYGFYSVKHKLAFNIGLPESLLSRFDLTFIILDQHTAEHNRRIGGHILRNHMTTAPATQDAVAVRTIVERPEPKALEREQFTMVNSSGETVPTVEFLRRYLQFAKGFTPMMSESAEAMISQHYVQLRSEQDGAASGKDGFFVTPRTLESIIRLSTANAKLRLSTIIEDDDVRSAMSLVRASVHAAADASHQRDQDREALKADAKDKDGEEPTTKKSRVEETTTTTTSSPAAATTTTTSALPSALAAAAAEAGATSGQVISHADIVAALATFQRSGRGSVELHELRERLVLQGHNPDPVLLHETLVKLDGDSFTFESTATSDTVYFL